MSPIKGAARPNNSMDDIQESDGRGAQIMFLGDEWHVYVYTKFSIGNWYRGAPDFSGTRRKCISWCDDRGIPLDPMATIPLGGNGLALKVPVRAVKDRRPFSD